MGSRRRPEPRIVSDPSSLTAADAVTFTLVFCLLRRTVAEKPLDAGERAG
jgi:hypothetical protein